MSKSFDKISQSLNIETSIVEVEHDIVPQETKKQKDDQITTDYEYTRGQLLSLIEKGQEAVNGILEVADSSQHPRAYEVAGQLIKNIGDVTDKLMNLHKQMKDLDNNYQGPNNVTNALFVGSTSELSKLLKNGKLPEIK